MGRNKNLQEAENLEWIDDSDSFDFVKLYLTIKRLLPWIVLCGIIGLAGSFLFLKFTKPVYQVKAKLLIKENDSKMGGIGKGTDMLQSLGIMSGANSVDNELEIITTYSILDKVVKDLQLNIIYTKKDIFGKTTEASVDMPWETVVLNYNEEGFLNNHQYIFEASNKAPQIIIDGETMPIGWNQAVKLPIGTFIFRPKVNRVIGNDEWEMMVEKPTITTENYIKDIAVEIPNKKASIINLAMESSNPKMGRKIINKVIDTYISDNLKDNNSINDSTMMFINARLVEVTKELNDVERAVQSFKQKNNVILKLFFYLYFQNLHIAYSLFVLLILILGLNLKNALKSKDFIHIAFAILMISLFLTESFLWRQRGMVFFALFYCLFNHKDALIPLKSKS